MFIPPEAFEAAKAEKAGRGTELPEGKRHTGPAGADSPENDEPQKVDPLYNIPFCQPASKCPMMDL